MPNPTPPGFPKLDPIDIVGDALAKEHSDIDLSKLNRIFQNIIGELQGTQTAAAAPPAPTKALSYPAPLTAISSGQALTTSYANVTGLSFNLTKAGTWLITLDMGLAQATGDFVVDVQLVVAGVVQSPTIQVDDGGISGSPIITASRTWMVTSVSAAEAVSVQTKKVSGTGASATMASSMLAVWYPG